MSLFDVKFFHKQRKFLIDFFCSLLYALIEVINNGEKMNIFILIFNLIEMSCAKLLVNWSADIEYEYDRSFHWLFVLLTDVKWLIKYKFW
jgi:hypothetical protein